MSERLVADIAHLLAGGVLLCSLLLLYQRRMMALIEASAMQGALLAAAALWQGAAQGSVSLYVTAAITFSAKVLLIPLVLRTLLRRLDIARSAETAFAVRWALVAGLSMVVLAVVVVVSVTAGAHLAAREPLSIALAVVLLGILVMVKRGSLIAQTIGLLSIETGVLLAAIGAAGMPLMVELAVAGLLMSLTAVAGATALSMRDRLRRAGAGEHQRSHGEPA